MNKKLVYGITIFFILSLSFLTPAFAADTEYEFPLMKRTARGKALVNFMGLKPGEQIVHIIPISDFTPTASLLFCTRNGIVKKTLLKEYRANRTTGVNAITLRKGDELISVKLSEGDNHVMIASKNGYAIKFSETELRPIGRSAMGVKGITLREGDEVVDMVIGSSDIEIITITNYGYGKRSKLELYRETRRGGKGVINIKFRHKNDGVNAGNFVRAEHCLFGIVSPQEFNREFLPDWHGESTQDGTDDTDRADD